MARYCDEECQANDFSHHAKSCHVLARRWDGVGIAPLSLVPLLRTGSWQDPAVLPSALARERIGKIFKGNRDLVSGDAVYEKMCKDYKV